MKRFLFLSVNLAATVAAALLLLPNEFFLFRPATQWLVVSGYYSVFGPLVALSHNAQGTQVPETTWTYQCIVWSFHLALCFVMAFACIPPLQRFLAQQPSAIFTTALTGGALLPALVFSTANPTANFFSRWFSTNTAIWLAPIYVAGFLLVANLILIPTMFPTINTPREVAALGALLGWTYGISRALETTIASLLALPIFTPDFFSHVLPTIGSAVGYAGFGGLLGALALFTKRQ